MNGATASITSGVLDAISAGILLYTATVELIVRGEGVPSAQGAEADCSSSSASPFRSLNAGARIHLQQVELLSTFPVPGEEQLLTATHSANRPLAPRNRRLYHTCSWTRLWFSLLAFAIGAGLMALLGKWA